ncbi:hypothetical protein CJJ23_04600 [Mycoplasmopsis agassizii]|uniref:ATP synthase gamma chain n=1 Tax=Mycoplasmopsis agassizii TaxID=33922 RepID=A0A269THT1_9BACT|nr:hypothetical protein [Mycoplasmopsis agassizii]PAK20941.1 hypothetical protein CJJ23_04600 [Mycoplasmopsis agassizii]
MDLKKHVQRLKNFDQVQKIVSLNRNLSLIEINLLQKRIRSSLSNSVFAKIIIQKLHDLRNVNSIYFSEDKDLLFNKKKPKKTLWIYLTNVQKYTKSFYERTDKVLEKNHDIHDSYISLGIESREKIQSLNYKLIASYDDFSTKDLSIELSELIRIQIEEEKFDEVKMIVSSNKLKDYTAQLYPINNFYFKYPKSQIDSLRSKNINFEKFQILPNIDEFFNSILNFYFQSTLEALIAEASFINYKNKLIEENKQLKKIDEEILKTKIKINKEKRELEIEEIVMITQNNKKEFQRAK